MILKETSDKKRMWETALAVTDLFLTTTNSTIDLATGRLVMGAGHALETKERWPQADWAFARALEQEVLEANNYDYCGTPYWSRGYFVYEPYYLLISRQWPKRKLGAFQTKTEYWKPARLDVIATATERLSDFCARNPEARVDMPYPGIGNGKLSESAVQDIVANLPDTVYIWRLT